MLRALLFLVKVGLIVAAAVWVADRPGWVRIEWLEYRISIQTGLFLLILLGVIVLSIFLYQILRMFAKIPEKVRRYRGIRRREAGYRALTLGLAAVAAGDKEGASYHARRAEKFFTHMQGLPLLLKAQAQRLEGREQEAQQTFLKLREDKDAGFLGVRGLLQAALDSGNYPKALELAREASDLHPKQGWILKLVYDLEIRQRLWEKAKITLYRAQKAGAVPSAEASSDRIALLVAISDEFLTNGQAERALKYLQQAYKYDPGFIPTALRLASLYQQKGQRRKAVAVIEQIWKRHPHPDLARFWEGLLPVQKAGQPMARLVWSEKLLALNPQSEESHLIVGEIAAQEGLWGEARDHFMRAEMIAPDARLYHHWIDLEKRAGSRSNVMEGLQDKAASAQAEKRWVCSQTGRIYKEWQPVAEPHGAFNSIVWDYPGSPAILSRKPDRDMLLEAPATEWY